MAKIETSELHKTPGGASGFFRQLQAATQCARQHIAELHGSQSKDMSASGAIHALALLAKELPDTRQGVQCLFVSEHEVDYWRETFFVWFEAVKRYFPEPLREEFRAKAEADFALIRKKTNLFPDTLWKQTKDLYESPIQFLNKASFDRACEAAKEKYPVDLGIALEQYLLACVRRLLNEDDVNAPLVVKVKEKPPEDKPGTVAPRLVTSADGTYSLIVTSFGGLQQPARSGMGLQNAVRKFLQKNHKQLLDELEFDSESSMFCVISKSMSALGVVCEAIFTIAANAKSNNSD